MLDGNEARLVERVGTQETHKHRLLSFQGTALGAVGLAFRPGADVVIQNYSSSVAMNLFGVTSITGYYSK